MMLFTICLNGKAHEGGRELLAQWQSQPESWLWIDLQDESAEVEQDLLCQELGLDDHALAEAQRPRHPPGFDAFPDHIYLLLKPLTSETNDLEFATQQMAVFTADRLLVTRHNQDSRFLSLQHQRLREQGCDGDSPLGLTAAITRRVADRYGKILLDLEHRLDVVEDLLFETKTDGLMEELLGYNTALRKMRRILAYHTNAFQLLRDHFKPDKQPHWHEEFEDIHSVMERFHSLSDMYQNVINDLIDGYISLNGHQLNQIMKVLTIVTVVFVPLTLLVGIYGMNFEYIPELKSHNGYYILLTVMAGIVAGLLLLFKRVRWL
ncbi:MAG: magnesium transporter CorA family protein [Sedimenticolaceae bacterium]|jgi:magnesium transporter